MNMKTGYVIEYSYKKGLFEELGDRKKAFCSQATLAHLLRCKPSYTVWSARWTTDEDYVLNNPDEKIEFLKIK